MDFLDSMKTAQDNISVTENGAVGYRTSGKELIDFFFKVSSFRNMKDKEVIKEVLKLKDEYTLKTLFYIRDIREGLGERRLFRLAMQALLTEEFEGKDNFFYKTIIEWIPEYGRYDDMLVFMDTIYEPIVLNFIQNQLTEDLKNCNEGKPITLLAKWLPSINTSSKESKRLGRKIASALHLTERDYRKTLSKLRKYNNIVERQMCAKEWGEIDYNKVPSKANLKYANAFLKNDEDRRREYLTKLASGDKSVKINAATNFPHDIVHKYMVGTWGGRLKDYDETLEQLWKNLPSTEGLENTIVVRDGSGSMTTFVGDQSVTCLEVSTALAIYCAERLKDSFKNKFITFSSNPHIIDLNGLTSLHTKLARVYKEGDCSNTNIERVFDLILHTAKKNHLPQDSLPKQVLVISDMEFDYATTYRSDAYESLFETISNKYRDCGYTMPKLVFWNVCSRTGTIPCKENKAGVLLVSGFSQNVVNMVNTGETDPYLALIRVVDVERYQDVPLFKLEEKKQSSTSYTSPLEK